MKLKLFRISLIFGLLLSLYSCKKEAVNRIAGKWNIESNSDEYIIFDQKGENQTFVSTVFFDEFVKGTWTEKEDQLILTYVTTAQVEGDSMSVSNSNSGES